jgi:hypothetical protein
MNFVLAAVCAALFASVVALARERRLRNALELLLSAILTHWRDYVGKGRDRSHLDEPFGRDHRL